ncbi:putative D,D-dipeptide transport system permease protein DdpC [subsurface metagenome]
MFFLKKRRIVLSFEEHPRLKEVKFSLSKIIKNPLSIAGMSIIFLYLMIALLAPTIAPPKYEHEPFRIPHEGYSIIPEPPAPGHPFGTTTKQYDIFYGVIWGTRTAFRIGFMVVGSILVIGVVVGSISGYFGGIVDEVLMRIVDIFMSLPTLILAMAIVTALGRSLDNIMKSLIVVGWPIYARTIRGSILSIREEDFVEAAKALGANDFMVIFKHILPNAIYPVLILASLDIGAMVLTAAALSFLGLGAQEGYADWGQMVSLARNFIVGPPDQPLMYWYVVTIPGLFILFFVLGWNLLGDAFRDIFDPKLRRK